MTSSSVPSILAMLAQPVGGNPTQYMIEKVFAHHDLDWRYLTFEVGPDSLGDAVRGLKVLGFCGGHCDDHTSRRLSRFWIEPPKPPPPLARQIYCSATATAWWAKTSKARAYCWP